MTKEQFFRCGFGAYQEENTDNLIICGGGKSDRFDGIIYNGNFYFWFNNKRAEITLVTNFNHFKHICRQKTDIRPKRNILKDVK